MLSSSSSEPKSYEPAGSSATTWSVVPIVIDLPPVEPVLFAPVELLLPPFLPAPQAASVTAATTATEAMTVLRVRDEIAMPSSPVRNAGSGRRGGVAPALRPRAYRQPALR